MFGLIKLAAYALFGYAIYEFVMGMSAESASQSRGGRQGGGQKGGGQLPPSGPSRQQQVGGRATTQESDGGTMTHPVGRGVISR